MQETSEPRRTDADLLRDHISSAGMSQRGAAKALGIDERTMRKYCAGGAPVPFAVLLNASRLKPISRAKQVIEMIDAGKLSTSDGVLTREQMVTKIATMRKAIDYLVGRANYLDI